MQRKRRGKGLEEKCIDKYVFSVLLLTIATPAKADASHQTSQPSHITAILRVELLFSILYQYSEGIRIKGKLYYPDISSK